MKTSSKALIVFLAATLAAIVASIVAVVASVGPLA